MSLVVFGGQAYGVQRRVTLAATTVANIFAQANNTNVSTITAAQLNQILAYPNLILYPYSGKGVAVVVSQLLVTVNSDGTATGTVSRQLGQFQWRSARRRVSKCRSIRRLPPLSPANRPALMSFSVR